MIGSHHEVEILIDDRGKQITTGQKRNDLIQKAKGEYIIFADDDDEYHKDYISDLIKGISHNPDCVTFKGWMTTDGKSHVDFIIHLGERYEERGGKYYRFPNHICAIRKSIAEKFKFHHITQGEDYKWALEIKNSNLLKTEYHIDKQLYHYKFITNKRY